MVPMMGWVARAAPSWPRLPSCMWSLTQAFRPMSLPMEPKKLITASAATTAKPTAVRAAAALRVRNWVIPKAMVKMPQRMYPTATRIFRFPSRSETQPKRKVETVVAAADTPTIQEMMVGSLAILA